MASGRRTTASIWDSRYGEVETAFGTEPNAFLASQRARFTPGMRALVPGDGEGRNGVWLATLGLDVVSVEASSVGCGKARRLAAARGTSVDVQCADLNDWPWPKAAFDIVAVIYVHFSPAERPLMHRRMYEALKPGGIVLIESYRPKHLERRKAGSVGGPPPEMLVTADDLRADFAGADVVLVEEVETVLSEGVRHVGASDVVRFVARRP